MAVLAGDLEPTARGEPSRAEPDDDPSRDSETSGHGRECAGELFAVSRSVPKDEVLEISVPRGRRHRGRVHELRPEERLQRSQLGNPRGRVVGARTTGDLPGKGGNVGGEAGRQGKVPVGCATVANPDAARRVEGGANGLESVAVPRTGQPRRENRVAPGVEPKRDRWVEGGPVDAPRLVARWQPRGTEVVDDHA